MDNKSTVIVNVQDSLLVVIDIQQRLAAAMPASIRDRVIEQVKILITGAKVLSVPTVVTEQYPKGLGPTEVELTNQLDDSTIVIEKTVFSCAKSDQFCQQVSEHGRKQIILTGMETHICILQTALDYQAQGFQVFVVEDAVSSRTKSNQDNALQRLRHAGVIITTVEAVIFEWLSDAKHPEFKTLAKLIA